MADDQTTAHSIRSVHFIFQAMRTSTCRSRRVFQTTAVHQAQRQETDRRMPRDYNRFNEEQRSFLPGWIDERQRLNASNDTRSIRKAFQYRSSPQLDTYWYVGDHGEYAGGGYVYDFRGSLSQLRSNLSVLHRLGWIDEQTRTVILQISLYNANIEMFTSVTLLVEFLSTGSLIANSRFEPISPRCFI